jgi:hypothetical protein
MKFLHMRMKSKIHKIIMLLLIAFGRLRLRGVLLDECLRRSKTKKKGI